MATKSSLISGMGVAMSMVQMLVEAVKRIGGTDEDIHHLITPDASDVWDKIADLIIDADKNAVVDYDISLKDAIAAGHYGCIDKDITEANFPPDEEHGKQGITFKLFHFCCPIQLEEAIGKMEYKGCRPCTLRELLAFGQAFPEFQRHFQIISLKSVWINHNGTGIGKVVALYGNPGHRSLGLDWSGEWWNKNCRFLAVGK